jgi:hypothetical protein
MSRVLIVKREGGRGFAVLIALLATIVLFHDTLARALGGPAERLRLLLGKTSAWDLGACLCGAAPEVTVVRDDGLKLAASVYTEDGAERRPAIVLLHGNTHRGRRLPLYKVLASRLAERGYVVLTLDRAGWISTLGISLPAMTRDMNPASRTSPAYSRQAGLDLR